MAFRALIKVLLGHSLPAEPGEVVPETYLDHLGHEWKVDFDRLLGLGAVEKVTAAEAKKSPDAGTAVAEPPAE